MGPTVWVVPSRLARSKATQTTWCAGIGSMASSRWQRVGGTDELPEQVAACRDGRVGRPVVTAGIGDVAPRRLKHRRGAPVGAERGERGLRCGAGGGWV